MWPYFQILVAENQIIKNEIIYEFNLINRKITLYRKANIEINYFQYKNNQRSFLEY